MILTTQCEWFLFFQRKLFNSPCHLGVEKWSKIEIFYGGSFGTYKRHPMLHSILWTIRADFKFAPSQWEMVLLCNDTSHWLDPSLESALSYDVPNVNIQEKSSHDTLWIYYTNIVLIDQFFKPKLWPHHAVLQSNTLWWTSTTLIHSWYEYW